jgi:hypothetical protein
MFKHIHQDPDSQAEIVIQSLRVNDEWKLIPLEGSVGINTSTL